MVKVLMMGFERLFFFPVLLIYSRGSSIYAESPAGGGCQRLLLWDDWDVSKISQSLTF